MNDAAIGIDGSVFLAGYTLGNWGDVNAGRSDFAVVKIDADGNEIWRLQVRVQMCLFSNPMTSFLLNFDCMSITSDTASA